MTERPPALGRPGDVDGPGLLHVEGSKASVTFRRWLAHPIEEVWAAVTEPEQLEKWFMVKVRRDSVPGGLLDMDHPNGVHATGRVLEWSPPHVYEYEWNLAPGAYYPAGEASVVRWELSPSDGGTLLVVTHRKLSRATAETFSRGFRELINRLVALLDGTPLRVPSWARSTGGPDAARRLSTG